MHFFKGKNNPFFIQKIFITLLIKMGEGSKNRERVILKNIYIYKQSKEPKKTHLHRRLHRMTHTHEAVVGVLFD